MKTKFIFVLLTIFAFLSGYQDKCYSQWTQVNSPASPKFIDTANNKLWITHGNGLSYSTNSGLNWISVLTEVVSGMDIFNSKIILTKSNDGVYISTNGGTNWAASLTGKTVSFVACDTSYMMASCSGSDSGIYRTSNYGVNWVQVRLMKRIQTLILSEGNLYIGTGFFPYGPNASFFKSTNYGNTFQNNLWMCSIYSIWAQGQTVYASADNSYANNGLNKSGTGGNYFTITSLTDNKIKSILCIGDTVVASSITTGVHVSSNGGINWTLKNEGFSVIPNNPNMVVHKGYLFLLSSGGILWKRSLSDLMTTVNKLGNSVPDKYVLKQNFPNPFNPLTKIRFAIPLCHSGAGRNPVVLKVYDIMGREVQTLVNESLQPGTYETTFDGANLTSGIYFYKIVAGDFVETRKMLMIK